MDRYAQVISHWYELVDDFSTSSEEFYSAVQEAVGARDVPDALFKHLEFFEGGFGAPARKYLRVRRDQLAFDICAAPFGNGFFFSWWLTRVRSPYPRLWFVAFVLATLVWLRLLLGSLMNGLSASMVGGDGGSYFLVILMGFPILLFLLGWMVSSGATSVQHEEVLAIPVLGWLYDKVFHPITYYTLDTALMYQDSVGRAVREVIDQLLSEQGLKALTDEQYKPTVRDLAR